MPDEFIERYVRLYEAAIAAERNSQSTRVLRLHQQDKKCRVDLGISDQALTEYVVVSRNPGGTDVESAPSDAAAWGTRQWRMRDYVEQKFRYAGNLRKVIAAFAEERGQPLESWVDRFGVTDISCFAG